MLFDLDVPALERYRSSAPDPEDFDDFWRQTLESLADSPLRIAVERSPHPQPTEVEVYDLRFDGYGGQRVHAWLSVPAHRAGALPGVVQFQGYGGGRGHPYEHLAWAASGFAHLVMDTRGQGAGSQVGSTGDSGSTGPSVAGYLTRGVQNPVDYYYRRVYGDAVRAVDALLANPVTAVGRVGVVGTSQGGGIALAATALNPSVSAVSAFVPFLCDFPRAARITDAMPYAEIRKFLAAHRGQSDAVFQTLSYFDGVAMARRITAPALLSAALMDTTCPPSTVFGAYNELRGPKRIAVWEFNGHEGGAHEDTQSAIAHARTHLIDD